VGVNVWEALRDVSEVHAAWAHRLDAGCKLPRKHLRGRSSTGLRLLLALLILALLLVLVQRGGARLWEGLAVGAEVAVEIGRRAAVVGGEALVAAGQGVLGRLAEPHEVGAGKVEL
jgi:hypothetical protein